MWGSHTKESPETSPCTVWPQLIRNRSKSTAAVANTELTLSGSYVWMAPWDLVCRAATAAQIGLHFQILFIIYNNTTLSVILAFGDMAQTRTPLSKRSANISGGSLFSPTDLLLVRSVGTLGSMMCKNCPLMGGTRGCKEEVQLEKSQARSNFPSLRPTAIAKIKKKC